MGKSPVVSLAATEDMVVVNDDASVNRPIFSISMAFFFGMGANVVVVAGDKLFELIMMIKK